MLGSGNDSSLKYDRRYVDWIPKEKAHLFETLMNKMADKLGSYEKAKKLVGLSSGNAYRLKEGKCSKTTASLILAAYKKELCMTRIGAHRLDDNKVGR